MALTEAQKNQSTKAMTNRSAKFPTPRTMGL